MSVRFPELPRLPSLPNASGILTEAERELHYENMRVSKALEQVAAVVDDIVEEFGLGHPATRIVEAFETFSPYSLLTRKLGIPAPGDFLDLATTALLKAVQDMPPLIEKPAGMPEIRKLEY